ncbi:MAG: Tetrahydromethanopterin S-methyltransferase subunit H [Methanomassiliicoccales archaeon PtaU1.Bin124]|nr:MAG: Tetrahydromethanopterin S-methyltransferase subunit H [Methanomassiliicoccales archaeon PtaU1.Bin124]
MFKFQATQLVHHIGGVEFGGQPGRRRTVMIGSLFYPRHSLVHDRVSGAVDERKLAMVLRDMDNARMATGTPAALMVYAETPQAMRSHVELLSGITRLPLFIDSPSWRVRIEGIVVADDMGISDRVVYNTISAGTGLEEVSAMREVGVRNAVALAFHPADLGVKGKIYLLEDGGGLLPSGLIALAKEAGVKNLLLDMAVLSSQQNAGSALRALMVAKSKWGLPCGCALHNAVESYPPLERLSDAKIYRNVDTAACTMPILAGADFVMFGPAEAARRAMYAAAFADEMMEQAVADLHYNGDRSEH